MQLQDFFFKQTEGNLGSNDQVRILFILREPNSKGEPVSDGVFWFKHQVQRQNTSDLYVSRLGKMASLLLDIPDKLRALQQCAYINLLPQSGAGAVGKPYASRLQAFRRGENCDHRWDIINNLPDGTMIVTTQDIAEAIRSCKKRDQTNVVQQESGGFRLLNYPDKSFVAFSFLGKHGRILAFSIYHPRQSRYHYAEEDIALA